MADNNTQSGANGLQPPPPAESAISSRDSNVPEKREHHQGQERDQKRHRGHGSRGLERGGGRGGNNGVSRGGRERKGEKGRAEWSRDRTGKKGRSRDDDDQQSKKRRRTSDAASHPFSKEEIAGEERRPKRKVAVLIGYAGTGYNGMQINPDGKTIEGDLFDAFVKAGAISKANADDPKKSSLVRCARTDKGVHAAGNVISLKLIVEDPDVVQKINEALPSQIRVWGYERTNGAFSCYQTCDSRWYEYLLPTYSLLPPHPNSFLGKKLLESAKEEGDLEKYQARQKDAADFWTYAEEHYVNPILDELDPSLRAAVDEATHTAEEPTVPKVSSDTAMSDAGPLGEANDAAGSTEESSESLNMDVEQPSKAAGEGEAIEKSHGESSDISAKEAIQTRPHKPRVLTPLDIAVKKVKAAYVAANKAYRISDIRRERLQEALDCYIGTQNFHNYTISKHFKDPSAKRHIKSFKIGKAPIIINDTEWLSLKVHGQSFMMHQIRKMVAMAALVVRCGCSTYLINQSFASHKISIPKAPGLGLLLERPVFDSYNKRAVEELEREPLDFGKYEKEMEEFKQREIYERIFQVEAAENQFYAFFHHIDHIPTSYFLWVTAKGIAAAPQSTDRGSSKQAGVDPGVDSEDEADRGGGEEG